MMESCLFSVFSDRDEKSKCTASKSRGEEREKSFEISKIIFIIFVQEKKIKKRRRRIAFDFLD